MDHGLQEHGQTSAGRFCDGEDQPCQDLVTNLKSLGVDSQSIEVEALAVEFPQSERGRSARKVHLEHLPVIASHFPDRVRNAVGIRTSNHVHE